MLFTGFLADNVVWKSPGRELPYEKVVVFLGGVKYVKTRTARHRQMRISFQEHFPSITRPLHALKSSRFDTEVTLYRDLVCESLLLIRSDFTLQQNLEIHKKMGMTDEQLEAYERQEREVCELSLVIRVLYVFSQARETSTQGSIIGEKMCDFISRHLASSCKELATHSLIFRHSSYEVVVANNSFISF